MRAGDSQGQGERAVNFFQRKQTRAARTAKSKSSTVKLKSGLLALEPRVLFDGAALATALDTALDLQHQDQSPAVSPLAEALADPQPDAVTIVFVDDKVENYAEIIAQFGAGVEIHIIDGGRDGVEQIADILAGRSGIEALQIISHGRSGTLDLGSTKLTEASMAGRHADEMAVIRAALSSRADILVYGCDFAAGSRGQDAIAALAAATGADVAASIDLTGAADLGGDWDLEAAVGAIETQGITGTEWHGLLTTGNTGVWTGTSTTAQGITATVAFSATSPQSSVVITGPETFTTNPFLTNGADGDPSDRKSVV